MKSVLRDVSMIGEMSEVFPTGLCKSRTPFLRGSGGVRPRVWMKRSIYSVFGLQTVGKAEKLVA